MSLVYGAILAQHLLISLLPWLAGVVGGGGLGYACALGARSLLSSRPGLRGPLMLLPWRTVALTLALLSIFVPILVGLGTMAGATIVGLLAFLLALPFTVVTLLEHWYPAGLGVRLIAGVRTLGTASVAVAAATATVTGSGGAGALIFQGMRTLDSYQLLGGLSIVVLLALIIDVLLGGLQLVLSYTSTKADPVESAVA
jgi:hypothetical protein